MRKIEVEVDLSDKNIIGNEMDIAEMESKCAVLEICKVFTRLYELENNVMVGTFKRNGDQHELRVNTSTNLAYVDYNLTTIQELISLLTDQDEISVLERYGGLNRKDYICRLYFKDGTIAFKDINGKWYVFKE